jgi:hypothetical protein
MTKKLEMLIGKQINRTQVKTKVVAWYFFKMKLI